MRPAALALAIVVSACATGPLGQTSAEPPAGQPAKQAEPAKPVDATASGSTASGAGDTAARSGSADSATDSLLELVVRVLVAASPEQRRSIEDAETARFRQAPSYDNLLRLTMVRAFSAALPSELKEARSDLWALANGRHELSDSQRYVALVALKMVDQRLQMGSQIADLQRQIDSLTEIEASLKDRDVNTTPAPEVSP